MTRTLLLAAWSFLFLGLTLAINFKQSGEKIPESLGVLSRFRGIFPTFFGNTLSTQSTRTQLIILIGLTLFVRLIPLWVLPASSNNFDVESFRLVGQKANQGIDVYTDPETANRHPYLPLQVYWIKFSSWFSDRTPFSFEKVDRIEPIIADTLIATMIFLMVLKQAGQRLAIKASFFFAMNPISWMVSVIHAQFDAVPILFLLLCLWFATSRPALAGFFMGLGILIKSWPVLELPAIIYCFTLFKSKLKFLLGAIFVPVVGVLFYSIFYQSNALTIISKAVGYNHGIGVWGYTYLLRLFALLVPTTNQLVTFLFLNARYLTLLLLAITWIIICRKENLIHSTLTILIAFFAFTHAFAIQYLCWLLPFALISMEFQWSKWYTLASFSYMFLVYNTLIMRVAITHLMPWPNADLFLIIPASIPVWLITLAWLIRRYKNVSMIGHGKTA